MNASGNGKMKTHDGGAAGWMVGWGLAGGGVALKLYLDLGLGENEIKCKKGL